MKTDYRRFRMGKNGTSYTTTLPKEWVKKYATKSERVRVDQYGETLFINPVKQEKDGKPLKIIIGKNGETTYYSIISAYLQNYDKIILKEEVHNEPLINRLREIGNKLPGAHFEPEKEEGTYQITFDNMIKHIPQLLSEMFEEYRILYTKNIEMFHSSPKTEKIDVKSHFVGLKEESVDRNFFLLKRLFTNVFENTLKDPKILVDTGLMKTGDDFQYSVVSKSVGYFSIANSLERLTDLQVDIFKNLKKVIIDDEDKSCLIDKETGYGFEKFYNAANSMIEDSYNSKSIMEKGANMYKGFQFLLKVLKAESNKDDKIKFREGYITKENRETILKLAENSSHLTYLEGQIWGSTGIATNIAEAWINMSDLHEINKEVKIS